jgi:hypothetical protein
VQFALIEVLEFFNSEPGIIEEFSAQVNSLDFSLTDPNFNFVSAHQVKSEVLLHLESDLQLRPPHWTVVTMDSVNEIEVAIN